MDDVIFAGTAGRPSRNLAEVTLTLDDTHGVAPPPFHEQAELEIVRRIERGSGSAYRVNGKEVRARDVQTLFADLASGARASAMVSQGRVGALVAAQPEERRAVLEEAAGITGLHARRHEAELKLRAGRDEPGPRRGPARPAGGPARRAEAAGAAGQPLPQPLGRHPPGRGGAAVDPADARRAGQGGGAERARSGARGGDRGPRRRRRRHATQADAVAESLPALRESESDARTGLERRRIAGEQIAARGGKRAGRVGRGRAAGRPDRQGRGARRTIAATRATAAEARLAAEDAGLAEADTAYPAQFEAAETAATEAAEAARAAELAANRATEEAADPPPAPRPPPSSCKARRRGRAALPSSSPGPRRNTTAFARKSSIPPGSRKPATNRRLRADRADCGARAEQERAEQARLAAQAALGEARARLSLAEAHAPSSPPRRGRWPKCWR